MARKAQNRVRVTSRCYRTVVRRGTGPMVLAGGGDLGRADRARTLVVDRLDGADHQLDAEALVDQVVAGPPKGVGIGVVAQQPDDRGGQRLGVMRTAPAAR